MRCICPTLALSLLAMLCGCRTQTASLTNPFLAPDRVPPPTTRTLVPGTAQPYYPGDSLPNSPVVVPPTAQPNYVPPGSQVVPPGGWNAPPQAGSGFQGSRGTVRPVQAENPSGLIVNLGEEPVRVQADEQNLRFAQTSNPDSVPQSGDSQYTTPTSATLGGIQNPVSPFGHGATVLPSQTYPEQLTSYQVPVQDPRPVRLRALPPGHVSNPDSSTPKVSHDGFRPQGSSLNRSASRPTGNQASSGGFGPTRESDGRFGHDANFQWVRGQLEYSEATNQWKLRYIPIQQSPDQFGGSVLIANPQVLGGVRPGEHVQLRGRLHSRGTSSQVFAPIYTVSIVQRQQI